MNSFRWHRNFHRTGRFSRCVALGIIAIFFSPIAPLIYAQPFAHGIVSATTSTDKADKDSSKTVKVSTKTDKGTSRTDTIQIPTDTVSDVEQKLREIDFPLVVVTTENGEEPTYDYVLPPEGCMGNGAINKTKVNGRLRIYEHDSLTFDSDIFDKHGEGMTIRIRGNGSALSVCKPYKVKFKKKCDPLFRNDDDYNDKNWALLNYNTTKRLRTAVGFHLAKLAGMEWVPAYQWVNVMLNGRCLGLYWLCETVRRAEKRVNISKSGFIVECDPYWWTGENLYFKTDYIKDPIAYTFKYPDEEEDLTDERVGHIRNYLLAFENALATGGDVSEFIDMESFATWILLHDITGQLDGNGSNIFIYKYDYNPADSTSTKLKVGPIWDLEASFSTPDNWCSAHQLSDLYFSYLFERRDFIEVYHRKWEELRGKIDHSLEQFFDSVSTNIGASIDQSRHFGAEQNGYAYPYHEINSDIQQAKDWFAARLPWMDTAVENLVTSVNSPRLTAPQQEASLTLYDLYGKIRRQATGQTTNDFLNAVRRDDDIPHGVYVVSVQTGGKVTGTRKWIK